MAKSTIALSGLLALSIGIGVTVGIASCASGGKVDLDKAASTVQMSVEAYCALPEPVRQAVRNKVTGGQQLLCN